MALRGTDPESCITEYTLVYEENKKKKKRRSTRERQRQNLPARLCHFSISEQLLRRNMKRLRCGLVFKAHRLLYHSTLGLKVMKKEEEEGAALWIT